MISPLLYGFPFALRSMIEKQPQILCSTHAALKAATSGPSSDTISSGAVLIDRPCSAYSGNTTRSIVLRLRLALPTRSQMRLVCAASCTGVSTTGSCSCTSPTTTPLLDLCRPPSPLIAVHSLDRLSEQSRGLACAGARLRQPLAARGVPCAARSHGPRRNSLRSLRSLCSNSRRESDVEARTARARPCALRSSAPHNVAADAHPPTALPAPPRYSSMNSLSASWPEG